MIARATTLASCLIALFIWTPPARAKGKVLNSLPTGKDGLQLQVFCERCKKGSDCVSVRAVGRNAPAKLLLRDDTTCSRDPSIDPAYSVREFKLSPTLTGALIKEESGGGEAIGHSYWLVAVIDGKISKLWDAMYGTQEMVGIDSYTLRTTDSDHNGRDEIDYVAPFPVSNSLDVTAQTSSLDDAGADTWEHQLLEFDDAKKAMAEKSPHHEFAAVLSTTKSLTDALRLKLRLLKDAKCGAEDFLVLETDSLPMLHQGFYVVASICESRADAQARLNRIKNCRPELSGAIRQVR